ncbi:PREDICTED: serpin I2 [Gekko japonicus]|uniref:Serpin I2 n=1 Tax=Gekko japonicus TaxID=146911 RepID=A0ABM1KIU5_GEKJA|nr:PREDICTED: serpin I2 [Gekko japonicus]
MTRFAVDLYRVLCLSQRSENILYSPLGAASTLGMVHLGAKGKAQNEISRLLDLKNDAREGFAPLQTLFSITSKRKEFTFNLANALYLQEGFMVKEQYLHSNKEFFQTAVKLVNFQDTKASAEAISTWVENKTDGQIKNFISSDDLGPLTRLVLANAIYFKGNWKQEFKAESTILMDFTKSDGSVINIPMMHLQLKTRLGHFSDRNVSYQVLELPYEGEEFSLVLILPAEDVPIGEVENLITVELIKDWFARMEEDDEVEISLPRFKIEQKLDLKETLQALDVIEIFNNGCDLSGLTDSADVHISQAIQKVCIEVNENGSEAAASTVELARNLLSPMKLADASFEDIIKKLHDTGGDSGSPPLSDMSITPSPLMIWNFPSQLDGQFDPHMDATRNGTLGSAAHSPCCQYFHLHKAH